MIAALAGVLLLDGWLSAAAPAGNAAAGLAPAESTGNSPNFRFATPGEMNRRLWCGIPSMLLIVLLAVLASLEMGRLCQAGGYRPATYWAAFIAAGLGFLPWLEMQSEQAGLAAYLPAAKLKLSLTVLWLSGGTLGAMLAVLGRKTTAQALANMGLGLFIFLYAGLLASFAVRIRCLSPGPAGAALLAFFLITVKSGDIGAYFTGRAIGKHKLAPWVSPGKTIEGGVGALVLAAGLAAGGMAVWVQVAGRYGLGPAPLSMPQAVVFGLLMAVTGHLGDLVESAVKRDVGTKDSGHVVPAFGGLLDIVDSPLFTAPIAWWMLTFLGKMS